MEKEDKKNKIDLLNNYWWFFMGLLLPIVGIIFIYFWNGKYEKTVKSISIGMFTLFVIILLFGVFYGK